jgi:hypothetical protein
MGTSPVVGLAPEALDLQLRAASRELAETTLTAVEGP